MNKELELLNLYEQYIINREKILTNLSILHLRVNTSCKDTVIKDCMVSSSIYMLDDYICNINSLQIGKKILKNLMVGAITCYWIIHKFEYDKSINVQDLKRCTGYSKYDYISMEKDILHILQYSICKYMPGQHPLSIQ